MSTAEFSIGESVWYKGKKWEIADHYNGTYCLWIRHKITGKRIEELDEWIPEAQLAKV